MAEPLARVLPKALSPGTIQALQAGDWTALGAALAGDPALPDGDRTLLDSLARGAIDAEPPSLPSYRLIRQIGLAIAPALRLATIAQTLDAARAATTLRAALAFAPDDPGILLALAWRCHDRGELDEAILLARRARAADPAAPECLTALGWFLARANSFDEAEIVLRQAIDIAPLYAPAYLRLGLALQRRGRLEDAEATLRAALVVDPAHDDARIALGWLLDARGRLDEALVESEAALLRATTPDALLLHGSLLAHAGRREPAIAVLERALALASEQSAIRCQLAAVLAQAGREAEAAHLLARGLDASPDDRALLLASAWLQRDLGQRDDAERIATSLLATDPEDGAAWQLMAALHEARDRPKDAEACVMRALAVAPHDAALVLWRARLIRRQERPNDAAWLVETLLHAQPERDDAHLLLAQLDLDRKNFHAARRRLHGLLRKGVPPGEIWWRLGAALTGLDRLGTARHAAHRACRLAPHSVEALRLSALLDSAVGDPNDARDTIEALLALLPDDLDARVLATRVALTAGALDEAERHAAHAVMVAPEAPDGWAALSQLRQHQARWQEAEDCLHNALRLAPNRADLLGALGTVLIGDDRLAEAEIALLRAAEAAPSESSHAVALAACHRLAGRFKAAIEVAEQALQLQPSSRDARFVRARSWIELSRRSDGTRRTALWRDGIAELVDLLREQPGDHDVSFDLIGLAAEGDDTARAALELIPHRLRRTLQRDAIEIAVAHLGAAAALERVALAQQDFPDDPWIDCAALNVTAMSSKPDPTVMTRAIRVWGRRWTMRVGLSEPPNLPSPRSGARLRIAYIASMLHERLLFSVLAAHDRAAIEPFLYTPQTGLARSVLGDTVQVLPLDGHTLAESVLANRIDVVIDTVGLHPFHGQLEVLRALARRIAPVQCGWLGSWGPGAGLFDALIVDHETVPDESSHLYDETIIRLPGGQWCWTPPLRAPDPGGPPCVARGHVVFGSTVRGFRLTPETLDTWARLLVRVPNARLELLGRHSRDWRLRAEIDAALRARDVDPARVSFQHQRNYADHLDFFRSIDVALDAFPGNAGLGLLDALWMGVPVVSCTPSHDDPTLAGSRQASSVLRALGRADWCATSVDDYVERAAALATDPARLVKIRAGLRPSLLASPLVDARRVAAALETAWRDLRAAAEPIATATSAKVRAKALAQRTLTGWLARHDRLVLPHAETPAVSVIVVLFNQAGLTHQCLAALADQTDVAFETIIVDNHSTDDTSALLARTDGAEILRNSENRHFLAAVNQAADRASGRHILLLNNDAVVQEGALAAAVARLDDDPTIGAVGGRVVLGDGRLQEAGCIAFADGSTVGHARGGDPDDAAYHFVRDVDFCSGAFLMVRAAAWRALGGFDPRYAPAYYEDTDLCLRLRQAGHRVVYDPAILVGHLEWGSASGADDAPEQMRRNQAIFLTRHRDLLACRASPRAANPWIERWAATPRPRVLIVDNTAPHVAIGGGMPRARSMLHALDRHHVTLFPLWQFDDDWRDVATTVPPGTEVMLGYGAKRFEPFLAQRVGVYPVMLVSRPPNLAWIERLRRRRPGLFAGMRVVYDAEALFALREIAQASVLGRPLSQIEQRRRVLEEVTLAATADRVLAVSQRDADWFVAGGLRDVRILTHAMAARHDAPGPNGRRGLLFIGALDPGTPNEDGLIWFVRRVMPLLPQDLVLSVVGEGRSSAVAALASERIRLLGKIDDLRPHYDAARMFIAPARFAAGVAAKIIEAACNGLPVVGSAVLAHQLGWSSDEEMLVARDAGAFADAIGCLDRDDALWRHVQNRALTRAADQFDPDKFAEAMRDAVAF